MLGGALSSGGGVFAWMKQNLRLPDDNNEIEKELSALRPGLHGLTILPFFAGERSTGWRADAQAAITGLTVNTSPIEILHAALASVALRFRDIYEIMEVALGHPRDVVGSGSAFLRSPVSMQMIADTLSHSVIKCAEPEATSRGAALLALERIGAIGDIHSQPAKYDGIVDPKAENRDLYAEAFDRQCKLYTTLFATSNEEDQ